MSINKKTVLVIIAALLMLLIFFSQLFAGGGKGTGVVSGSTVKRDKIIGGQIEGKQLYLDQLGWIKDKAKLEQGLKTFYEKTGVVPFLILENTKKGEDNLVVYNETDIDEYQVMVVFSYDEPDYIVSVYPGVKAADIMDEEGCQILRDYIDSYYYNDSMSDEEVFSDAFADAADSMMTYEEENQNPKLIEIILTIIAIVLALTVYSKAKSRKDTIEN